MDFEQPSSSERAPKTLEELWDWLGTLAAPWPQALRRAWKVALAISPALEPAEIAVLEEELSEMSGYALRVVAQFRLDQQNRHGDGPVLHNAEKAAEAFLEALHDRYPDAAWTNGCLYVYSEEARHFEKVSRDDLVRDIADWLKGKPVLKRMSDAREITERVISGLHRPGFLDGAPPGINVDNGFARWNKDECRLELVPHGPEHKARFRLFVPYTADATAPTFLAGLERLFPDRRLIDAVQEMFAVILFGIFPEKDQARNVHILEGPPGSGKSTLVTLLEDFFSNDVKSSVPPASWINAYSLARLAEADLNTVTELPGGRLLWSDRFKQVSAREIVAARHPREREFQFRCRAKHVFACNALGTTADKTNAIARRVLVIRMPRSLGHVEMDGNFLSKVREEQAGIIRWAAEGAARVTRNQAFTIPPGHEDAMLDMQHGDNLIPKIARRMVEAWPGGRLTSAELQRVVAEEYALNEREPPRPSVFMKSMSSELRKLYGAGRNGGNNGQFWSGVRWRSNPDADSTPPVSAEETSGDVPNEAEDGEQEGRDNDPDMEGL